MRSAVVLASAPGALDELAQAPTGIDVIAVNQAGVVYLGPVAAWGSVHADQLDHWLEDRIAAGGNIPEHVFGESFLPGQYRDRVRYYGPVKWQGSSSLYVVQWAIAHGYDRIACAGVHLTGNLRHEAAGIVTGDSGGYEAYRVGWRRAAATEFVGRVRSYGGYTRELLGEPDDDFWR